MAGTDKNSRRTDAGRSQTQSQKPVSKTASGSADVTSQKQQDAEWGFDPRKSGMAVEAKMGAAIVMILVCAFGFLVYHKYNLRQQQLLAQTDNPESQADLLTAQQQDAEAFSEFYPDQSTAEPTSASFAAQQDPVDLTPFAASEVSEVSEVTTESPFSAFGDGEQFHAAHQDTEIASTQTEGLPTFEPDRQFVGLETSRDQRPARDPFGALAATQPVSETLSPAPHAPSDIPAPTVDESAVDEPAVDAFAATFRPESLAPAADVQPEASPLPNFTPPSQSVAVAENHYSDHSDHSDHSGFAPFDEPVTPPAEEFQPVPYAAAPESASISATFVSADMTDQPALTPDDFTPLAPVDEITTAQLAPAQLAPADDVSRFDDARLSEPHPEEFAAADFGTPSTVAAIPADDHFPGFDSTQNLPPVAEEFPEPAPANDLPSVERDLTATLIAMADPQPESDTAAPVAAADTELPQFPDVSEVQVRERAALTPAPFSAPASLPQTPSDVTAELPPQQPQSFTPFPQLSPPAQGVAKLQIPSESAPPAVTPPPEPPAAQPTWELPAQKSFATSVPQAAPEIGVAHLLKPSGIQQVAAVEEPVEICDVRPKDTYWSISKRMYGTPRYFSSLALYNQHRIPDPKKLRPGMKVLIPAATKLETQYPELFPDLHRKPKLPSGYFLFNDGSPGYRVGEDETLSEISLRHLGRASRWTQIYQLNQTVLKDPNKLKPGAVIRLPQDATDVHMAP